jgi:hypothetical protein
MTGLKNAAKSRRFAGLAILLMLLSLSLQPAFAAIDEDGLDILITGRGIYAFRQIPVYALTDKNEILLVDERTPFRVISRVNVTGLGAGENLTDVDFRPATGELYGVSSASQLYIINTVTGAATAVGGKLTPAIEGTRFGLDFNPTVDRIRLVSDSGQNLRLNPNNGTVAATDGKLAFAAGDANAGKAPKIQSAAYTNSFAGSTRTTLFNLDADLDILTRQDPPNNGTQNTVGGFGVPATEIGGFDIRSFSDYGIAAVKTADGNFNLWRVDLTNGKVSSFGRIGNGETIRGLSTPIEQRVFALTSGNELISFDRYQPRDILTRVTINGVASGETIVGIDFRPVDGLLYGVGSTSQLYQINTETGAVRAIGSKFTPALEGNRFIFDFNPTVDRIRLMSDTGQNLRLNPETGATAATDGKLAYAATDANTGKAPKIVAGAYTNSFVGTTSTGLFNLDADQDVLTRQDPPNNGTQNTVAKLSSPITEVVGFDIASFGMRGLVAVQMNPNSPSVLYTINLMTGQMVLQDMIGQNLQVRDIALPIGSREY